MNQKDFFFYLSHIVEYQVSISRGIALLRQLAENEDSLIEAFALRASGAGSPPSEIGSDTDRFHMRIKENCLRENDILNREKLAIWKKIQSDKRILLSIVSSIFTLKEPMRNVMVLRYIDKLSWADIQKQLDRSAASVFKIHREAIQVLENFCCQQKSSEYA